ncbi:MAG: OadG family protein [Lachnospiraceae bacterium]|nr:OadG family protein [Lachnospiraceae bacterium]
MNVILAAAGEPLTFGERMVHAGLNTLLGMGMAFFVLIIVMLVIMLFPLFIKERKPRETRVELTEKAIDNTISQIEEHEALEDDSELVAVIAAAIAAAEGSPSVEGVFIRSIRRHGSRKQWQKAC